jgi:hypothetical protein
MYNETVYGRSGNLIDLVMFNREYISRKCLLCHNSKKYDNRLLQETLA